MVVGFKTHVRLSAVKSTFGDECHAELTRSAAADEYVHKDETSVPGTRFQLGKKALKRNSKTDWDAIKMQAKLGQLDDIPGDVFIRYAAPWLHSILYG